MNIIAHPGHVRRVTDYAALNPTILPLGLITCNPSLVQANQVGIGNTFVRGTEWSIPDDIMSFYVPHPHQFLLNLLNLFSGRAVDASPK
jgi:hypothetical protein